MKTICALLSCFFILAPAWGQAEYDDPSYESSSEQEFYEGDQMNIEGSSLDPERQEEEALPYSPYEEIYPYEDMELEGEENYEYDY